MNWSIIVPLVIVVLVAVIGWFTHILVYAPRKKQKQAHQKFPAALKVCETQRALTTKRLGSGAINTVNRDQLERLSEDFNRIKKQVENAGKDIDWIFQLGRVEAITRELEQIRKSAPAEVPNPSREKFLNQLNARN